MTQPSGRQRPGLHPASLDSGDRDPRESDDRDVDSLNSTP